MEQRTYSCLVKWKSTGSETSGMSIEEVRFHRRSNVTTPNEMLWVQYGNTWLPRGDQVAFAVSNQQVIRDGELVPVVASCHQFGDLRHLISMPNLNPNGPLYPSEPRTSGGGYRPRRYFHGEKYGDLWFGEQQFLADSRRNLLRAALAGPVVMELPAGASQLQIRGAFSLSGYRELTSGTLALAQGDWRFLPVSGVPKGVEVFFKRSPYGWSMIGLSVDNRRLLWLACTGLAGRQGYLVEEAAEILKKAGAHNALLIDEGFDVFQTVRDDRGMRYLVPRDPNKARRRLRATFIAAQRIPPPEETHQDQPPAQPNH